MSNTKRGSKAKSDPSAKPSSSSSKKSNNSTIMSKVMNKFSLGLVVAVGVAFVAYQQSGTTIEDVGEQIAQRLIEILPRKPQVHRESHHHQEYRAEDTINDASAEDTEDDIDAIPATKESSFDPVGEYNAKEAMQARYDGLKETCKRYADHMRPERMMTFVEPDAKDLIYYPTTRMTFCPINKVAHKMFHTMFTKLREPGPEFENKLKYFTSNYPRSAGEGMRALMVRHPMERIVSAYRYNFERSYNAATGEEEGGEITFPDFVDIVLNGPVEYANFLEENELASGGESMAIDTSMIDGEGTSNAWNPYWRQCGVCNNIFEPHYIMHMDHFNEDLKVLIEDVMGNPEEIRHFSRSEHKPKSGLREVEEHYYSQLTKAEIRQLHEKYRIDHELFGFSPDYYIAMGK